MATITGTSGSDKITGTSSADTVQGLGGNDTIATGNGDDTLKGGRGADTMTGGPGNDTYYVDNAGDVVIERAGGGMDTVIASISWTLGANLEKLTLSGGMIIDGIGNELNNVLLGNAAANVLLGMGGDDTLDGGAGADTLKGGTGNDIYIIDDANDRVIETIAEGTDLVKASISYTLGNNIEKLLLTGNAAIDGTGNSLGNIIMGNAGLNDLSGLGGNDTIDGGAGADRIAGGTGLDTVTGGAGNDVFVFATGDLSSRNPNGADVITDFAAGDRIDLSAIDANAVAAGEQAFAFIGQSGFTGVGQVRYEVSGGTTYVYGNVDADTAADFCIALTGVTTLSAGDFVL